VWTWQVPLYFWSAHGPAGSAGVALAADLVGDEWSASVARKVALGAVAPAPLLLIRDLGRPARFLNMLRVFQAALADEPGRVVPRLVHAIGAGAVGADLLKLRPAAKGLGAVNALLGGYLGSYTGVLLAATAVPLWARSRIFLGPSFVSTATATGAAATRLVLVATGRRPVGTNPRRAQAPGGRRDARGTDALDRQRAPLGRAGRVLSEGRAGRLSRSAQGSSAPASR